MKKRILIVDDSQDILDTVEFLVADQGYELNFATRGQAAIEKVKNGFKGLILLDAMMPHLSGWETIQELVKLNLIQNVVICMMTCVNNPNEETESVMQYISGYITKPFTEEQLLSQIADYYEIYKESVA